MSAGTKILIWTFVHTPRIKRNIKTITRKLIIRVKRKTQKNNNNKVEKRLYIHKQMQLGVSLAAGEGTQW